MPRATVTQRVQLICSDCGEDISTCGICEECFEESDEIYCYEEDDSENMGHAHMDCVEQGENEK